MSVHQLSDEQVRALRLISDPFARGWVEVRQGHRKSGFTRTVASLIRMGLVTYVNGYTLTEMGRSTLRNHHHRQEGV